MNQAVWQNTRDKGNPRALLQEDAVEKASQQLSLSYMLRMRERMYKNTTRP